MAMTAIVHIVGGYQTRWKGCATQKLTGRPPSEMEPRTKCAVYLDPGRNAGKTGHFVPGSVSDLANLV